MGNFEKLSVLVIVVIIVMILVVALYTWTDNPDSAPSGGSEIAHVEPSVPPAGTTMLPAAVVTPPPTPPIAANGTGAGLPPGGTGSILDILGGAKPEPAGTPAVTPPPAPEAPKPSEPKIHVVEPGQTMGGIAKLYYPGRVQKGLAAMMAANPEIDSTRMRVGQKLTIPDLGSPAADGAQPVASEAKSAPKPVASIERGGWYVTKRGDTLTSISRRAYGTTERWPEIWIENMDALGQDFERPDPGIRIRIPR